MCIAHVRIVTEEYLGFPQWLWFSNCLQTWNSIDRKCCIKTCEYFILTIKENCQADNYGNLERNCSYRIMVLFHWYLGIRTRQIMPRDGDFASFFWPGGQSFALKSFPRGGILTEKISGPGVSPGGWLPVKLILALCWSIEDSIEVTLSSSNNVWPYKINFTGSL